MFHVPAWPPTQLSQCYWLYSLRCTLHPHDYSVTAILYFSIPSLFAVLFIFYFLTPHRKSCLLTLWRNKVILNKFHQFPFIIISKIVPLVIQVFSPNINTWLVLDSVFSPIICPQCCLMLSQSYFPYFFNAYKEA